MIGEVTNPRHVPEVSLLKLASQFHTCIGGLVVFVGQVTNPQHASEVGFYKWPIREAMAAQSKHHINTV